LSAQLTSLGSSNFSGLPVEDANSSFTNVNAALETRRAALQEELSRQQTNESHRVEFAKIAGEFKSWLDQEKKSLEAAEGKLEQQLENLRKRFAGLETGRTLFDKLTSANKTLEVANVTDNQHTNLSLRDLQAEYTQFLNARSDREKLLEKEILIQQGKNVSAEQIGEFKEVFQHFDTKNRGALEKHEFKACLQSLGQDPSEAELERLFSSLAGADGKIHFDEFVNFMVSRSTESFGADAIIENMKILANDKDFILEEDLRRALPGDKVDYLIKAMPAFPSGGYDYKAWAHKQVTGQ